MRPLVVLVSLFAAAAHAQPQFSPQFPASLKTYLTLTDDQMSSITSQNAAYDRYASQKQQRILEVRLDLAKKTAADPIDSLALGLDYAEIEAIRRDLADKLTQLRADNAKVLTDPQRAKIKALDDAQQLLGKAREAECQNLLAPVSDGAPIPVTRLDPVGGTGGVIGGIISVTPLAPVPATLGLCGFGAGFPSDLTAYFGLTAAQLDTINQLDAAYARFVGEKQQRIAQVQAYIATEMSAETLDPGAIGQAYAEIEAINRDLRDKLTNLRADLAKVLTGPQKILLQALADARGKQSLISAAQCENLLAPPAAQWFNTTGFATVVADPVAGLPINGDFAIARACGI